MCTLPNSGILNTKLCPWCPCELFHYSSSLCTGYLLPWWLSCLDSYFVLPSRMFLHPICLYPHSTNPSENRKPFSSLQVKGSYPTSNVYIWIISILVQGHLPRRFEQFLHKPRLMYWTMNRLRAGLLADLSLHLQRLAEYGSVEE